MRLEPLKPRHEDPLAAIGLDPELWALIPYRVVTKEQMSAYVQSAFAAQATGTVLPFATVDISTGTVIGSTRFMNIDIANRRVEIGSTFLGKPWQRTRANTEAKYLMLRHAFETWQCVRVELKTDATNLQSRAAIRRLGAKEEGILREHMLTWDGRRRDTVYYSILEKEWPEVRDRLHSLLAV